MCNVVSMVNPNFNQWIFAFRLPEVHSSLFEQPSSSFGFQVQVAGVQICVNHRSVLVEREVKDAC